MIRPVDGLGPHLISIPSGGSSPLASGKTPFSEVLGERGAPAPGETLAGNRLAPGPARSISAQPAHSVSLDGIRATDLQGASYGKEVPPALRHLLVRLVEGEERADAVIRAALSGRDFTIQETIAIQAAVLKHAQEMEVVSRVLDRLTGAVKGVLQTQV